MKIIKQFVKNLILVLVVLFISFVLIVFIESFWKSYTDTDFLFGTVVMFLMASIYSFVFVVIHSLISLYKKNLFIVSENKILLLIPLASSYLVESIDFRWFDTVKDIDNARYLNYVILCLAFLLISSLLIKNNNEIDEIIEINKIWQ